MAHTATPETLAALTDEELERLHYQARNGEPEPGFWLTTLSGEQARRARARRDAEGGDVTDSILTLAW